MTTAGTLVLANAVALEAISLMGSAAFLVVFGAVNLASLRLAGETGASRPVALLAVLVCVASLVALVFYAVTTNPALLGSWPE